MSNVEAKPIYTILTKNCNFYKIFFRTVKLKTVHKNNFMESIMIYHNKSTNSTVPQSTLHPNIIHGIIQAD